MSFIPNFKNQACALIYLLMVTVRSVEFGNNSDATWTLAPVTSRISLILDPPFPISEPHCEAGTTNFNDTPDPDFDEVEADEDLPLLSPLSP